jgi:hypothetical protein
LILFRFEAEYTPIRTGYPPNLHVDRPTFVTVMVKPTSAVAALRPPTCTLRLDAEHAGAGGSVVVVVVVVVVGGAGVDIQATTPFTRPVGPAVSVVQAASVRAMAAVAITPSLRTAVLDQPY